jgi:glycosyltransferase involved in cell wall biosynthesis
MKTNFVSVIIVNWNGKHHLGECLSSLTKQTLKNFEIIFIDNGSTDESAAFVNRKFPDVKIVELKKTKAFAGQTILALNMRAESLSRCLTMIQGLRRIGWKN